MTQAKSVTFKPSFDLSATSSTYERWKKWMRYGEHTGCHQKPERSFFIKGYQLPVCARCTGVIIGYILALPLFIRCGFFLKLSFLGCAALLMDWGIQEYTQKESTNRRRLLSGIVGGYGIMSMQLKLFSCLIHKLH